MNCSFKYHSYIFRMSRRKPRAAILLTGFHGDTLLKQINLQDCSCGNFNCKSWVWELEQDLCAVPGPVLGFPHCPSWCWSSTVGDHSFLLHKPPKSSECRSCGCAVGGGLVFLGGLESFNLCPSPAPRLLTARPSMCSLGTSSWQPQMDCLTTCLTTWSCRSWKSWRWALCPQTLTSFVLPKPLELLPLLLITFVFYIKTPPQSAVSLKGFSDNTPWEQWRDIDPRGLSLGFASRLNPETAAWA